MPLKGYIETTAIVEGQLLWLGGLYIPISSGLGAQCHEFPVKFGYVHLELDGNELVMKSFDQKDPAGCTLYRTRLGGAELEIPKNVAKSPGFPLKAHDNVIIKADYDSNRVSLRKK